VVVLNVPFVPFYTEVVGREPLPSLIEPGELALNLADGKIFSKKTDGSIVVMGSGAAGGGGGVITTEPIALLNPSFESPAISANSFSQATLSGWQGPTASALHGNQANGYGPQTPYPNGTQCLMFQMGGVSRSSWVEQTITVPADAATVTISYSHGTRTNYMAGAKGHVIRVYLAGALIDTFPVPNVNAWAARTLAPVTANGRRGNVPLRFEVTQTLAQDETTFFDNVVVSCTRDSSIATMASLGDVSYGGAPAQGQPLVWNGLAWTLGPVLGGVVTAAISARYWRITTITTGGGGYLDLTELHLRQDSTVHAATVTGSTAGAGSLANLVDGTVSNGGGRNYWGEATAEDPGFWIQWDLGTAKTVNGLGQAPSYLNRGVSRFVLQHSQNGTLWSSLDAIDVVSGPPAETLTVTTIPTSGAVSTYIPFNINRLDDVDTSTIAPASGNALVWNGTNWVPGTPTATADLGLTSINALADVVTTGLGMESIGRALVWNGTTWSAGSRVGIAVGITGDPQWANVNALWPFDNLVDRSSNVGPVTLSGTVSISGTPNTGKWLPSSLYFPDQSGFAVVEDSALVNLTTGGIVECWFYPTNSALTSTLWHRGTYGSSEGYYCVYTSTYIQCSLPGGSHWQATASVVYNAWNHIAIQSFPGVGTSIYLNGTRVGTNASTWNTGGGKLTIGGLVWNNRITGLGFVGRISDFRLTKTTTARYTGTTAPIPSGPFPANADTEGGYFLDGLDDVEVASAATGSFLYFDGAKWSPTPAFTVGVASSYEDIALAMRELPVPNIGARGGSAAVTGSVVLAPDAGRYGGAAVSFTGGYVQIEAPALPGDFVLSGWTRVDSRAGTYDAVFELGQYTNGILFRNNGDSWINGVNIGTLFSFFTVGVYTHWLWSRTGTTVRLFIGGVQRWTGTIGGTVNSGANPWRIGADVHMSGGQSSRSTMSWLRMTIGSDGGFTAPFTPPASPPTRITGAPFGLNALSDVVTDSPAPVTNQALIWDGTAWVPGNPTVGGVGRATAQGTTPSIAVNAAHILTISGVGRAGVMIRLKVDGIAWLTVYSDLASATADAARSISTDPSPGSGVIAEAISTNSNWIKVTPAIGYFNLEAPTVDALYVRVVNQGTAARTFVVDLEVSRTEP